MNLKCLICHDIFSPNSKIYSTPCGHLFHYNCLLQWITIRSKTCPQCRATCTLKCIHRIYLSVEENVEYSDISVLLNQIDNLHSEIRLKNVDIENAIEKYKTIDKENTGLQEELKALDNKFNTMEPLMRALKEQISSLKLKSKNAERLKKDVKELKEKLKGMEHLELVITGCYEQVNDMLKHNRDPRSLSVLVCTLKKQLLDSDKKRKQTQVLVRNTQKELQTYKNRSINLNKENISLQQQMEAHKNCDTERQYLMEKIKVLQDVHLQNEAESANILSNPSFTCIIAKSPALLRKQLCALNDKMFRINSGSVGELVQSINGSKSPHFQIEASSID